MQKPPFSALAQVYDELMADVEYEEWLDFVLEQAERRGHPEGRVLDLGCGTGNMTIPLARRGYRVTGLDGSMEMLEVARGKAPDLDWRLGEFTSFDLGERFALAVSVFDSLNNLISPEQFLAATSRVRCHLVPDGLFLFDVNTRVGLADPWHDGLVEGWAGDIFYRWVHSYDPATELARVEAYCEHDGRSFTEVHLERPFDPAEVTELLASSGFVEVETLNYPDGEPAGEDEERIWVVARAPKD
ncbi:MAG TPA: methyltransferase domain-containing protein [Trueperaceae bacterium]